MTRCCRSHTLPFGPLVRVARTCSVCGDFAKGFLDDATLHECEARSKNGREVACASHAAMGGRWADARPPCS